MEPVDFFKDVYVRIERSGKNKHLQLKFNPIIPVSEYSIDFSSLAPSLLSGTTVRLRCGRSTLELRNCDEVWNCASEEQSSIDLSKILPEKEPTPEHQLQPVPISPSSEPLPTISKRRREDPYPAYPSTQPLLHCETDFPANKKRRVALQSVASSPRKVISKESNMPSRSSATNYTERPPSSGAPLLPDYGHLIRENLAASSSPNFYKIPPFHYGGTPSEVPQLGGVEPASNRKGKARETKMQTGSAYIPAHVPSGCAPSSTQALTEIPSAMQPHMTNQRLRWRSVTPSGIPVAKPSVVVPDLPTYGALLGSYENPEIRPYYPGTPSTFPGVDSPVTIPIERSESGHPLSAYSSLIGSDDPTSYANLPFDRMTPPPDGPEWASKFYAAALPSIPYADIATQGVQMSRILGAAQDKAPEIGVTEPTRKRKRKEVKAKATDNLHAVHGQTKKKKVDGSSETGSQLGMCGMIPGEECFRLAGGELYKIA